MSNKFFEQVSGIINIKLRGRNLEKIINLALSRGIFINDVTRKDDSLHFKIRASALDALKSIADENGYNLEVTSSKGLPFYQKLLRRRLGFVGGAVIFVIALYLLSSFVWFIEVSGPKNIEPNRILTVVAQYGVYQGAPKWSFSCNEVEEALLRDISELTYARLDIRGVKARIEVVEKVLPREEITGPCHMIASRDGVVEEILVLDGEPAVKEGDAVARGDILISGVVFPKPNPYMVAEGGQEQEEVQPEIVRARGEVKARVWYEGYGECRMREERLVEGRVLEKRYLITPWRTFMLKGNREGNFQESRERVTKKSMTTPLGEFALYNVKVQEQIREVKEYTESQAVKIAGEKALQTLKKKTTKSGKLYDSRIEILSLPSDPILRVKVSAATIENIAVPEAIPQR
ncbi:sporulation protein YqfD [Syntrophomonas erecta]